VTEFSKQLSKSISAVRDLTYDLHPAGMDQLGLVRTTFQYCSDFSSRSGIKVDFFSAGMEDLDLDFDTGINIFRIIQEGLNNIRQHAEASQTAVRLVASAPFIILRIEDNGKGFAVSERLSEALTEKRMGLSSMEERAGLLGGSFSIQSTEDEGTKIKVEIPIRE
jgi:signal transduction histidine kinase